jgi:hypothetical protein
MGSSSWQRKRGGGSRRTNLWIFVGAFFEHMWGITPMRRRRGRGERQVEGQRRGRRGILRQLTTIFAGASSCKARRRIGCRQWEKEDCKTLVVCSFSSGCVSSPRHARFASTRSQGLAAARHPMMVRMAHLARAACTRPPAHLLCTASLEERDGIGIHADSTSSSTCDCRRVARSGWDCQHLSVCQAVTVNDDPQPQI